MVGWRDAIGASFVCAVACGLLTYCTVAWVALAGGVCDRVECLFDGVGHVN
nr:MAG TPA: hypothetical protein [Caudoviricetes sp.]